MNDFEKILTGGGMVFKKKGKDENAGEKKIKFSDFLRGRRWNAWRCRHPIFFRTIP